MVDFVEEIEGFLASFSPEEEAVLRHAFRALVDGRSATVGELPGVVGLPPVVVEDAVGRLSERGIIVVEPETDQILGARGLSLTETSHRLILDGQERYAFCAVDAVGIPAALGITRYDSRKGERGDPPANRNVSMELDTRTVMVASVANATAAGAVTLRYGAFLNAVINFLIVAFAVFMMVWTVGKMRAREKEKEEQRPTEKECPHCFMKIPIRAVRCGFCTSTLEAAVT